MIPVGAVIDCEVADLHPAVASRITVTDSGCWTWTGYRNGHGYGSVCYPGGKGRTCYVHRWVYAQVVGPIPEGMEIDHLCRVPSCCNPAHLEVVTPRENKRRQQRATCGKGHPMHDAYQRSDGGRTCRHCTTARNAARVAS